MIAAAGGSEIDLPAWFLATLACPADGAAVRRAGHALECPVCGRVFSTAGGIPRMLLEGAPRDSAQAQQRVYDTRNTHASAWAQEAGFATQLIYRRELLLDALDRLQIERPQHEEELWVYVGGGEGTQCIALSEFGGRHMSLDISATQLELGRWLIDAVAPRYLPEADCSRVVFVQADGEAPLPLRPESADVAYGLGVLNHLPPDLWADHLRQLYKLLKPGGVAFQVVPNIECEVFRSPVFTKQFADPSSMQYWTQFVTESRVTAAFQNAGLERLRVARLWRLNHDSAARHVSRADGLIRRVAQTWGLKWSYPLTRTWQGWLRRSAERGGVAARPWTFDAPRHLAIAGLRPPADAVRGKASP